jgi:hypothetical protein
MTPHEGSLIPQLLLNSITQDWNPDGSLARDLRLLWKDRQREVLVFCDITAFEASQKRKRDAGDKTISKGGKRQKRRSPKATVT